MANVPATNTASPPSSSPAADSYIGSFISVTSKYEIRYEGVLYHLDPQDSTLGLKDVRSFGTEGRKTNGPQVPPSDKVYEYILFRGSDIKDLQVKTAPPVRIEESIYDDPAIIQSNGYVQSSSSSKSISVAEESLTESKLYEPHASSVMSYPSIFSSHHSGTQFGTWDSLQSTPGDALSYGLPAQLQGYTGGPTISAPQQRSLSSTSVQYPLQNQTSITMTNLSNNFTLGHPLATSTSVGLNNTTPSLSSELLSIPFTDSFSTKQSLPSHHSTLTNSNGMTVPFQLAYQNPSNIEVQIANNIVSNPTSSLPIQSSPYLTSSFPDPISDPFLRQQRSLLTPNLSQPKLSEHPPANQLYHDWKDVSAMSSLSLTSGPTPTVQPPLLPLPSSSQKLQYSSQFTEEFDFQAMNEKFNKDEVWGYLGKANQKHKGEGEMHEIGSSTQGSEDANPDLVLKHDPKPAYKKDDFFDTISRNSIGRGGRDGQNRSFERVKLNSETFGSSQQRNQFGYSGHRGGHGGYRRPYNWGRDYNYVNRGRGGYTQT